MLALACELYARAAIRWDLVTVSKQAAFRLSAIANEEDRLIKETPDPAASDVSATSNDKDSGWEEAFLQGSPKQRDALAQDLALWLALVDREGNLVESYPPGEGESLSFAVPKELTSVIAALPKRVNVKQLLDVPGQTDVFTALESAFAGTRLPPRYYGTTFPQGTFYDAEWLLGLPSAKGKDALVPLRISHRIMEKFGYKFRANIDVPNYLDNWPSVRLKTNALGWRDDEVILPKPPGIYRIVCVGGSTTVGGPRGDLTYPNMVERKLRERLGTDKIEVINCGMYAASSDVMTQRMADYLALEPDLFIQYDFINDFLPDHRAWITQSSNGPWFARLQDSEFVRYYLNHWFQPDDDVLRAGYRDTLFSNFQQTIDEAHKIGARAAFASFAYPDPAHMQESWEANWFLLNRFSVWHCALDTAGYAKAAALYNVELKKFCEEHGALYLPVAENVQGGAETFMDMCHMRLPAMDKMADTIANSIQPIVEQGLSASSQH